MKIGIDIDDTLTEIEDELLDAAYQYAMGLGKTVLDHRTQFLDRHNDGGIYQKVFGFDDNELKYFLANIQESITNSALPRPGVVETIKRLKEDGHHITIITARDSEFHEDPYTQSKTWLDKHNIMYDKLIVNARDKQIACKNEGISLLIDDSIGNCERVREIGVDTIRICKPKNINTYHPSFSNWQEIYDYIGWKYPKVNSILMQQLENNNLVFERAEIKQIDEIRTLYAERTEWFQEKKIRQWSEYLNRHPEEEFIKAIEQGDYYILKRDGKIVAGYELNEESKHWSTDIEQAYYICKVVTKVGTHGIGKFLLETAKDMTRKNNKTFLRLECLTYNEQLNHIYENYGFSFVKNGYDGYHYTLREWKAQK